MANTNNSWPAMSDNAIIAAIGTFIKQHRLTLNRTQSQIARDAGVNRWTIGQIENGAAISLISLIQILRALNLLHILNAFTIEPQFSPIEMAKLEQQKRKRARNSSTDMQPESDW